MKHARTGPLTLPVLVAIVLAASPATGQSTPAQSEPHTFPSVRDCELAYRVHRPRHPIAGPAVLIAHGFMRNGAYMRGWAEAIADSGLTAVTADLCASSAPGGRHPDNGADLAALRRSLGFEDVVYVGVSAGGLAALVAASLDPAATRGLLLLDPVNAGGQARRAAGRVHAPVAALVARPQVCNAWRNIDRALETLRDATIVQVRAASHCDFEWPSDSFCRATCLATGGRERRHRAEESIRAIGLGFVQAIADGGPDALARWKADIGPTLQPDPRATEDTEDTDDAEERSDNSSNLREHGAR